MFTVSPSARGLSWRYACSPVEGMRGHMLVHVRIRWSVLRRICCNGGHTGIPLVLSTASEGIDKGAVNFNILCVHVTMGSRPQELRDCLPMRLATGCLLALRWLFHVGYMLS